MLINLTSLKYLGGGGGGDYPQNEILYYDVILWSFRLHNWCYVLSIWHCKFHSCILYFVMYLDSGYHAVDSRFQALDSRSFVIGPWIPDSNYHDLLNRGY